MKERYKISRSRTMQADKDIVNPKSMKRRAREVEYALYAVEAVCVGPVLGPAQSGTAPRAEPPRPG
jgi:hypothetical protein